MKLKDKIKDLNKMGEKELNISLAEKKEKIRKLRFDLAAGKVKNIREIRETKRDIARILTRLKMLKRKD